MEVIPTIAGQNPTVVSHDTGAHYGHHSVVKIVEQENLNRIFKGKRVGDVWILPNLILVNLDHNCPKLSCEINIHEILNPGDPSQIVDRELHSFDEEDMLEWSEEDAMADAGEE
ncbi:hypothetical protein V6N12_073850 [Hibiscus sabdariffa]|uniref:Uncharacterized protein n=1 Tax=Hibiscus sabdariffa TaxID=183260 RepID=A0ABR2B759_9ROSI